MPQNGKKKVIFRTKIVVEIKFISQFTKKELNKFNKGKNESEIST